MKSDSSINTTYNVVGVEVDVSYTDKVRNSNKVWKAVVFLGQNED